MPRVPYASRIDCDNLAKSLLDGLTSIAWNDDAQVAVLHVEKWICAGGESPRTEVEIEEMRGTELVAIAGNGQGRLWA